MLHVYSQGIFHDDATLVVSHSDLPRLLAAVQDAIRTGMSRTTFFPSDGEGFDMVVCGVEDSVFDKLKMPYTDEMAMDRREDCVIPEEVIYKRERVVG